MADTREKLLQAGMAALRELDPETIIAAIGTRELARRAGVSSATFFHHFPNMEAYVEALIDKLYPMTRDEELAVMTGALAMFAESTLPVEMGKLMFHGNLATRVADQNMRSRIGLWALSAGRLDDRYGAFMSEGDAIVSDVILKIFDAWGRELRPPIDVEFMSAIHNALVSGAAIRYITSPDRMDGERFAEVAMIVTMGLLRLQGDRRTMEDRLAELNFYPRGKPGLGKKTTRAQDSRARIIDAASSLFGQHGFEQTSIAMIARAAKVSDATVYDQFGSKAGVAIDLFETQARDVIKADATTLREHLIKLADFTAMRSDHARPYLTALALNDPILPTDSFVRTTTRALVDDDAVADLVLVVALNRVIASPSSGAEAAADWAIRVTRNHE